MDLKARAKQTLSIVQVAEVADVFARLVAEPWPFTRIVFAIIGGRPELRTFETFSERLKK